MTIKAMYIIAFLIGTLIVIGGSIKIGLVDKVFAAADVKTITTNNNITLGNPVYIEYDKITNQQPVVLEGGIHAFAVTFSGNGTVKGISFTQLGGKALIIPISKGIADIFGSGVIKTNNDGSRSENSTFSFREISHANATDGTLKGIGVMIFTANATGKLAFLGNTVAIFKEVENKDGNRIIRAWEWKY